MKNYILSRITIALALVMLSTNMMMAASATIRFTVSGTILDEDTKQPLVGVVVMVHDPMDAKPTGTTTDVNGKFSLEFVANDERALLDITYVGYEQKSVSVPNDGKELSISMHLSQVMTKEVVVSASRVPERIMESPVTIEKQNAQDIKETPANNFYESVANMKSVDMVTSGIAFKTINIRGFGNTEKPGFVQLIDGMDNQSPGLNYSVGYNISDLDVDNMEVIPGTASALYGANAFNGIMNITSKNPFEYQGISVQMKTGVNHVSDPNQSAAPLNDLQVRVAKALNKHWAVKANVEYFEGRDWAATDATNVSPTMLPGLEGLKNPSYDGLNIYGDEVSAPLPIGPNGSPVVVNRTGYAEKDLMNYNSHYLKYDGSVNYRFNDSTEVSYVYKSSTTNSILHSSDRYALDGFGLTQQKVELKAPNFFVRAYTSTEASGNSYDSRFLAINMDEAWKNSNQWFNDYATAFMGGAANVAAGDYNAARAYADLGRPMPGTAAFNHLKDSITAVSIANGGASFDDHTRLSNVETQYNFKQIKFVDVIAGSSFRDFNLNSNGTLYDDKPGTPINFYEYGAYTQVSKKLLSNRLRLSASFRYDKSENYEGQISPRFAAVYDLGHDNFIRASYQTGFRMPTSQDQYIDLNVGPGMRALGGLPSTVNPYDVVGKVFTVESVTNYGNAVGDYIATHPTDSNAVANAVESSKSQLKGFDYNYVKPERVQSFEIGYKGLASDNKLFYDLSMYYTINHDFIGYYTVVRPNAGGSTSGDAVTTAAYSLIDPTQAVNIYQLTTNLAGAVNTYGIALSTSYNLPSDFVLTANATYSKLDKAPADDARTLFNTPDYKTNVGLSNKNVFKNVGFALNWRWTDRYMWESLFGDGMLNAANNIDAQLTYRMPKIGTSVKFGATNALNYQHTEVYGGGTVGAIYYVALRYDGLFK